ncbi:MAG TPA: transcriptional regulator [Candidatus Nanoarchaeia archaeon]|nr:transcriptional regulator [Candidatus Nanoarchaeia archaeon]
MAHLQIMKEKGHLDKGHSDKDIVLPTKHPQEIEVWYVIPAIRKELALDLVKSGKSQREVASLLGITESAISQYVQKKRAKDIPLPPEAKEFIKKAALHIKDQRSAYHQIHKISQYMKESKVLCKIHSAVEDGLEGCDVCYNN